MSLIVLLFGFGFVKLPFIALPALIVILPFSTRTIRVLKTKQFLVYSFMLAFFLMSSIAISVIHSNDYDREVFFILSLVVKFLLMPFIAYELVHDKKHNNSRNTLIVIFINVAFVTLGYVSKDFYLLSLQFLSPDATEVFKNLYRVRSVGFGAYHLEMAIFGIAYAYVLFSSGKVKTAVLTIVFVMTARIYAIFYFLLMLRYKKILLFGMIPIIVLLAGVNKIVYDYFEIFINLFIYGELNFTNMDHLISMVKIPPPDTLLYGDGRFFNGSHFYQGTDIGIIRMLYFSGIAGLIYFAILNIYPFSAKKTHLTIVEVAFFLLVMLKGLAVSSLISWIHFYERRV